MFLKKNYLLSYYTFTSLSSLSDTFYNNKIKNNKGVNKIDTFPMKSFNLKAGAHLVEKIGRFVCDWNEIISTNSIVNSSKKILFSIFN